MIRPVTLALAMVCAVPVFSIPAFATDWDWDLGSGSPTARHRARVHYARRHHHDETKVMAYVKREGEQADAKKTEAQCVDKVRGLGTQWIGTEGAMDAAKKDWMERVRYDYGESFIDMTNAKDFVSRCGRVSIAEVAGQVTYRCEILARPCKATMKEAKATK